MMTREGGSHDAVAEEIPNAFRRWARTIFAAPRRPEDLITDVQTCDEIIERLATCVTRREIREVRTGTRERRSTASRIDRSTVDPFAFSAESLRVESQYIAQCETCSASGMRQCETCHGSRVAACRNCGGSGKQRSEKTGRPINCKVCKKSGRVPCGACSATGSVSCRTCSGSGHQLAWLELVESEHWLVSLSPQRSPITLAHKGFDERRPLTRDELSPFSVIEEKYGQGASDLRDLGDPYRQLPQAHRAAIDRRLEQIQSQQYLRLAVVRRDVTYQMCGTSGTVVLSGKTLLGATTAEAARPIRRRLYAWAGLVGLVAVAGAVLRAAFIGSSGYFDDARPSSSLLLVAGVATAVPAFGTLLRAWRGGARFHKVSRLTLAMAGSTALALLGIAVVGLATRPSQAEVRAALSAGDVGRARVVVEALRERETGEELLDLEDRVALAEAGHRIGQDRLKLLDRVAHRKGAASAEAATAARNERLSQIRSLVKARDKRAALAALDEWFRGDASAEVSEERARAYEAGEQACTVDTCRWIAAVNANAARTTDARAAQVAASRAKVWEGLAQEQVYEKSALPRLKQARLLMERASAALEAGVNDAEMSDRAAAAIKLGQAERRKIPLLGMDLDVARELMGSSKLTQSGAAVFTLDGVDAYANVDKAGRCTGIFAVGSAPGSRVFKSETWSAPRLLSQALGRPIAIPPPSAPVAQWYDGGMPIVVRWRGGEIVELRVGDAMP
jgi:hypothetical protein